MQKKFLGNLVFIILLNLLIKPFYIFGIDIQVQNMVGPQNYGLYFTLLNFSFLFNMFLDIGITNYNTKNTAQSPSAIEKYLGSFMGIKVMLALLYIVITLGAGLLIGYSGKELYLLQFFILNQILAGMILYIRSNFAGLHFFKIDAILSVLDRLLIIVIASFFIYGNITHQTFKIEWFIYMQTFAYATTLLIGLVLTQFKIGRIRIKISRILSLSILKRSFPFALLILLMMLYTRIDSVMIQRLLPNGDVQAGIYAQGFRLLDAVNMFAFLVAGLLLPIFSRLIGEKSSVKPVLQMAAKLLIGIAVVVGIGIAINSELVISTIYQHDVSTSSSIFFWLILCFIPLSFSHVFSTLLTANHNLKLLNIMALCGIATNVILNFILIPKLQARGAAIATITTQSVAAALQVIFVIFIFKFKIHWNSIIRFAILIGVFTSMAIFFKETLPPLWNFITLFICGGLLLFILRLINIRDVLNLLQSDVPTEKDID